MKCARQFSQITRSSFRVKPGLLFFFGQGPGDNQVNRNGEGRMKKFIITLALVAFVSSGCTGSFMLTKKVYNWHRSQSDKWADEFGFLVCTLIPIYGISTFADALVFNSIEFWTGKNPVEAKTETNTRMVETPDAKGQVSYNSASKELTIASQKKGLHPTQITLIKDGNTVVTKDKNGDVLSTTTKNENGDFLVFNKKQELVRTYTADQIAAVKQGFEK